MTYGIIPEKIIYVSSVVKNISYNSKKEAVIPAFICIDGNPKTLATAVSWADSARLYWDNETKQTVKHPDPVVQDLRDNVPLTKLRIVGLDVRGNGGRAYKIISQDKYYIDLREEILLDIIYNEGIDKGGLIKGEFIWARVNSEMRLIRVNSDLYKSMIDCTEKSKLKKLKAKELKPGSIYKDKKGNSYLFLNRVNGIEFDYQRDYPSYSYSSSYSNKNYYKIYKKEFKNAYAYLNFYGNENQSYEEKYRTIIGNIYGYDISSSHPFIEYVEDFNIVPNEELDRIKELILKRRNINFNDKSNLCYYAKLITATPSDQKFVIPSIYDEILKESIVKESVVKDK